MYMSLFKFICDSNLKFSTSSTPQSNIELRVYFLHKKLQYESLNTLWDRGQNHLENTLEALSYMHFYDSPKRKQSSSYIMTTSIRKFAITEPQKYECIKGIWIWIFKIEFCTFPCHSITLLVRYGAVPL